MWSERAWACHGGKAGIERDRGRKRHRIEIGKHEKAEWRGMKMEFSVYAGTSEAVLFSHLPLWRLTVALYKLPTLVGTSK